MQGLEHYTARINLNAEKNIGRAFKNLKEKTDWLDNLNKIIQNNGYFYLEAVTGSALMPGVIAAIQTFGDRINLHPHLHFLVTEGGVDEAGVFHKVPRFNDSRLVEIFTREVLADLVRKQLLSPEWAERLLSWRHTGFSVHSRVQANTKTEAERVGKYMIRPLLSLERLSLDEKRAQVCYRYGSEAREMERMDYLEFIARVVSHIPDKGQVTVRYYGLYANAHRGKMKKASFGPLALRMVKDELRPIPSRGWAEMIRKVYEVDPMVCPRCGGQMKVIAFLTDYAVVDRIIDHLKLTFVADKPPPPHLAHQEVLVAAGTTMVVVCHAIEPLAGLATRALTVREGSIAIRDELPAAPEARLRLLDALARGKA
jgi:hypothetical protein